MAKFVVAGKANCSYYAKAELLADYLQKNLPDFHVFKIVQSPDNWQSWLQALCKKNGWVHQKSPIIWRELVDRGGKGLLLGGFNDFMEYAQGYYGFTSDMMTALMLKIAKENLKTNEKDQEEEAIHRIQKKAMAIWISGALCPACAILIPALVNGEVFGHSKEVSINLLHIDGPLSVLQGLQMEIEDMAWPLLQKVTVQNSLRKAFMDAEVIILLDDLMPEKGQSIEDCYREMGGVYQEIAIKIDTFAKPNVRVIVAGNYILNLKTYLLMDSAYAIDHCNFVAVSTQLEGEVKALLARKLNVSPVDVKDVIVWGNIGRSTYIDLHKARVHQYESAIWGPPEFSRPVLEMLRNKNWIEEEFVEELHAHRPKIQAALKHGLGLSTAVAIQKVLNWWYHDSPPGEFISLGVVSQGDFDIPSGIIFSVPVRFCGGKWVIQSQIEISEETKDKLKDIVQELKKPNAAGSGSATDITSSSPAQVVWNHKSVSSSSPSSSVSSEPSQQRPHIKTTQLSPSHYNDQQHGSSPQTDYNSSSNQGCTPASDTAVAFSGSQCDYTDVQGPNYYNPYSGYPSSIYQYPYFHSSRHSYASPLLNTLSIPPSHSPTNWDQPVYTTLTRP